MSATVTKRRIQRLGGSSLIITLPKTWIKKIGLNVGDAVIVVDEGDHLKILPPDTRVTEKVNTATIRITGYLKNLDLARLVNCAYINGYNRIEIIPFTNGKTVLDPYIEALVKMPRVKDVRGEGGRIIVELDGTNGMDGQALVKRYNSLLQSIIETGEAYLEGQITLKEAIETIEAYGDEAYHLVDSIIRQTFRQGLIMCESSMVDPTLLTAFKIIARLLERAVKNLITFGHKELALRTLNTMKPIIGEAIGGVASGSGKRIINSMNMINDLKSIIEEIRSLNTPIAQKVATCVESLAIAMDTLDSKSICSIVFNNA